MRPILVATLALAGCTAANPFYVPPSPGDASGGTDGANLRDASASPTDAPMPPVDATLPPQGDIGVIVLDLARVDLTAPPPPDLAVPPTPDLATTHDLAVPPTPDLAPGQGVACDTTTCAVGSQYCCSYDYGGTGSTCLSGGSLSCPSGQEPFACDGPEDCSSGDVCCYVGGSGSRCRHAGNCSGQVMCHSAGTCSSSQSCCGFGAALQIGTYGYCGSICPL